MKVIENASIYFYDAFAKEVKENGLQGFKNYIEINESPFILKHFSQLLYKINKLYINPYLHKYSHTIEIDYKIGDAIKQWNYIRKSNSNVEINLKKRTRDYEYFNQDITKAMLQENIISYQRYHEKVTMSSSFYNIYLHSLNSTFEKNHFNSITKKISSIWYSYMKAYVFCYNYMTIGTKNYMNFNLKNGEDYSYSKKFIGYNIKYDVPMELYKGSME